MNILLKKSLLPIVIIALLVFLGIQLSSKTAAPDVVFTTIEGRKIAIRATKDSDSTVVIEGRDYGPGIPRDKRRLIFKPGYRSSRQNDSPGGLGIGLPLCKMLVQLHGGSIWLESAVGKGSKFYFSLPLDQSG